MANEIQYSVTVTVSTSGQSVSGGISAQETASNLAFIGNEQTVGTSAEALVLGDIGGNPVFVFVKNLDDTNFLTIDAVNTLDSFPQVILPGMGILLRPSTGTIYAKGDTAPVKAWVVAA